MQLASFAMVRYSVSGERSTHREYASRLTGSRVPRLGRHLTSAQPQTDMLPGRGSD
jgi:hypothetical protein